MNVNSPKINKANKFSLKNNFSGSMFDERLKQAKLETNNALNADEQQAIKNEK